MLRKIFLLVNIITAGSIDASEMAAPTPTATPDKNSTTVVTPHEKKQLKERLLPFSNIAIKDIDTEKLLHYLIFLPQRAIDYSMWHFLDRKKVSPQQQESLSHKKYFKKIGARKIRTVMQPLTGIGATCIAWYFLYRPVVQKVFAQKKVIASQHVVSENKKLLAKLKLAKDLIKGLKEENKSAKELIEGLKEENKVKKELIEVLKELIEGLKLAKANNEDNDTIRELTDTMREFAEHTTQMLPLVEYVMRANQNLHNILEGEKN